MGALAILLGLAGAGWALWTWAQTDFGRLSYARMMRVAIPSTLFMVLGFQTVFSSFFGSVLGMGKK